MVDQAGPPVDGAATSDDDRYIRHIEARIAASGLEGVGVVKGATYAGGQSSVAQAEEIERRLVQVHNDAGKPIVGVVKSGPPEEQLHDATGTAHARAAVLTVDRPLAHDETVDGQAHPGVVMADLPAGDGQAVLDGKLVDVDKAREAQRRPSTLVADRRLEPGETADGQELEGVVMGPQHPAIGGDEIVRSDRSMSNAEIDAQARDEAERRQSSKAKAKAAKAKE